MNAFLADSSLHWLVLSCFWSPGEKEETSDMQDLIESTPELNMDLSGYKASR